MDLHLIGWDVSGGGVESKKMAMIQRHCEWCDVEFGAQSWEVARGRGRYCSVQCKSKYGRSLQDVRGENNPAWKGGIWRQNTLLQAAAWNKANPEKRAAHHAVEAAIKRGDIQRSACSECGAEDRVDAHHEDYSAPLDIEWLCRSCHLRKHRAA